jgi:hypothetical protein
VARSTCGLVAMTSASHAEGRQFDPGQVYVCEESLSNFAYLFLSPALAVAVAYLGQGIDIQRCAVIARVA